MKVLVVRFSSIGDIVLTTPILRCIKAQKPDTEVHFLTKASFRAVLSGSPYIDKLFYLEEDLQAITEELKKEGYDCIIDLHKNVRSARVRKALKVPAYTYPKLNVKKWLLVNPRINIMPDESIVERYFEAVKPLGVHNDGQGLDYYIPDYIKLKSTDIPMSHWGGYLAFVIGGSYNTKKLPVEQWIKLIGEVPYPVILLGGPEDREDGNKIASADTIRVYNACGKFNLNESAYLVKNARVVVSNDTGLMHMAAAFDKPIISFWGNTSPEMGMFPYYGGNNLKSRISPKSIIIENKRLYCHPCSKLGYEKCPRGHFKCMKELDMTLVAEKVKKNWVQPQP